MNEDIFNELDDKLEELPEEVQEFIFGGELDNRHKEMADILQNEQQSLELETNLTLFLFGAKSLTELKEFINTLPIADEKKNAIRTIIQEKVINELLLLTEIPEDTPVDTPTVTTAPSPAQVLETLKSRLTEAKSIAPTVRDHSIASVSSKPIVDPYREMPEK
jgi:hypothetical protein